MKIDRINHTQGVGRYETVRRTADTYAAASPGTDKVELSKDALSFAATYKAVKAGIAQRTSEEAPKVSEIERRVEAGSYDVEARLVAEGMLRGIKAFKNG